MWEKDALSKNGLRFWLGLAISAVALYLAFRNTSWSDLAAALLGVNWFLLSVGLVADGVSLAARGWRWQVLLLPLKRVPAWETFEYLIIGYMGNNLLPFRLAEIARAVLLAQEQNLSKTASLATVVVERLLDVLSLIVLIVIVTLQMEIPAELKGGLAALELVAVAALSGLLLAAWADQRHLDRLEALYSRLPLGFGPVFKRLLGSFIQGLGVLRSARGMGLVAVHSALAWLLGVVATYLFLASVGVWLPWYGAAFVLAALNVGISVPSSPGYVGVFHYVAVLALALWAVPRSTALSFALIFHGLPYILTVVLGLFFLWRKGLALGQLQKADLSPQ